MNKILCLLVILMSAGSIAFGEDEMKTKVRFTSPGGRSVLFLLDDNATVRDFLDALPGTMDFEDYGGIEKITYPPEKLSTQGAPDGYDPSAGDICLYAPWGDICIFYRDFSYAKGLVRMGTVIEGAENIRDLEGAVKIEVVPRMKE